MDLEGCDLLVNNAAINIKKQGCGSLVDEIFSSDWERGFPRQLRVRFMLCRALLPEMRSRNWSLTVKFLHGQAELSFRAQTCITRHRMLRFAA